MAVVDCVETNQSREQPQIGLGETVARKVAMTAEALLVSRLSLGEAAAIDAIVDRVVNKSIRFFDRTAQHRGVEVERRIAEFLEFRVQHANDFGGFIIDDRARLAVPQDRDSGAAGEARARGAIDLMDMENAVDRPEIVEAARIGPSLPLGKVRLQDRNRVLEPL